MAKRYASGELDPQGGLSSSLSRRPGWGCGLPRPHFCVRTGETPQILHRRTDCFARRNDALALRKRSMTDFIKPRLYLITPPVADAEGFAPALKAALGAGDVACVLLRFAPPDEGSRKKIVQDARARSLRTRRGFAACPTTPSSPRAPAPTARISTGLGREFRRRARKPEARAHRRDGRPGQSRRGDGGGRERCRLSDVRRSRSGRRKRRRHAGARLLVGGSFQRALRRAWRIELDEVEALAGSGAEFVALGPRFFDDPRGTAAAVAEAQAALDRAEARGLRRRRCQQSRCSPPLLLARPGLRRRWRRTQPDLAFGAYQRGFFRTAFQEAMKRVDADPHDAAAMTLVAELCAQGVGAPQNLDEAMRWYRLAAESGRQERAIRLGQRLSDRQGREQGRRGRDGLVRKGRGAGPRRRLVSISA